EVYEAFLERKVYINKKLKKEYPLMANAVYDDENRIQIIIMIWGLPWESMTLGQMNQLVVVSSLIGNAVLRANRYLRALEEERFIEGTKLMESEAFTGLLKAYVNAEKKGWTQCTVLELIAEEDTDIMAAGQVIAGFLRQHDYVGMSDGKIYVLLSNTREEEAVIVVNRIAEKGYSCRIVEGDEI
nr:NAD(P)-dependent oxidoreductase [Lachnospiraceae bacterium]